MMVTHLYESHSRIVDMIFDGIEDNEWADVFVDN